MGTISSSLNQLFLCLLEHLWCLCRCGPFLRQHRRHDWIPPGSLYQVLLEILHPSHVHCEFYLSANDIKGILLHPSQALIRRFFSLQGTFAFSLIKYTPLKYNNEYVYPWWGHVIGWLLALSSMVCIPLWMVYKIGTSQGTIKEVRVSMLCINVLLI